MLSAMQWKQEQASAVQSRVIQHADQALIEEIVARVVFVQSFEL